MKTCKLKISGLILALGALLSLCCVSCGDINDENKIYPQKERGGLELVSHCPDIGEEDVSTSAIIRMQFLKELEPETVNPNSILLGSGRHHVKGNMTYEGGVVTYYPTTPLDPNTRYNIYFTSSLRDIDGFAFTSTISAFSFTTGNPGNRTCRDY